LIQWRDALTIRSMTTAGEWRQPVHWWRLGVTIAGTALAVWAIIRLTVRSLQRHVIWTDFALFHATVNRWLDGLPMYAGGIPMFGAPRFTESVNFNPPQFHLLVLPFAHLDLWTAVLLWQAVTVIAGSVCAAIVVRTLRVGWSPMVAAVAAAVILNSAALSSTLWFGQMSVLLAIPVTLAWRALRLGRWNQVGAWMGLAGSIKPFVMIVFPYLLLKRQWRALIWGGVSWAASFAVGAAVFGPDAVKQWLEAARWPTWLAHFHNASFQAYVSRVMFDWPGEHVASIGSAAGILSTVWIAHKRDVDLAWAFLMAGAILWAPLGWVYYEWCLMPPIAALLAERRIRPAAWLLVIAFVWPITWYPLRITGTQLDGQVRSMYFWGLLGLWLVLLFTSSRTSSCNTGTT
jgi:alpha-1,2-mannosyltransferase